MRKWNSGFALFLAPVLGFALCSALWPAAGGAATVTFSGTISYAGTHAADTLYVAVFEVPDGEVTFIQTGAFPVGPPPFSQPFDLEFDSSSASGPVVIAAVLDLPGGGLDTAGEGVLGWYGEGLEPTALTADQTRTGLDFSLPTAEVQGTVTFRPGQTEAFLEVRPDLSCWDGGFRPPHRVTVSGPYAIRGVYPGTYCVRGSTGGDTPLMVCSGDPTCVSPTSVTLSGSSIVTDVDLDFTLMTPVESITWGELKGRY